MKEKKMRLAYLLLLPMLMGAYSSADGIIEHLGDSGRVIHVGPSHPCKTLSEATEGAEKNDLVIIHAGEYEGPLDATDGAYYWLKDGVVIKDFDDRGDVSAITSDSENVAVAETGEMTVAGLIVELEKIEDQSQPVLDSPEVYELFTDGALSVEEISQEIEGSISWLSAAVGEPSFDPTDATSLETSPTIETDSTVPGIDADQIWDAAMELIEVDQIQPEEIDTAIITEDYWSPPESSPPRWLPLAIGVLLLSAVIIAAIRATK